MSFFKGILVSFRIQNGPLDPDALPICSHRIVFISDGSQMNILQQGMDHISQKTCIKFKARTTERNYIRFQNGDG